MEKVKVTQKGDHFLSLGQELEVKKQDDKGNVWVDGIQNGTKRKIIEQIVKPDEYAPVERNENE